MKSPAVDVEFEQHLLDTLGRILLDDRDFLLARDCLLTLEQRLNEAPAVAFKHKVTTVMAANARLLSNDTDPTVAGAATRLASLLERDEQAALAHRELLLNEVERVSAVLGDRAVIIKGFCNSRFYPEQYVRWMRDIDLLCPSWTDALELLEALLSDGYEFDLQECSWVKADPDHGRDMYGQVFLIRPIGSDFSRVDIHFGTYSVGYAGYLRLPDPLSEKLTLPSGQSINVLLSALCPLIAQAHALSDGYVSAKDINDFVAMSRSSDVDWRATGQILRAHQLQPQAARLARHSLKLYRDPKVTEAAKQLLSGLGEQRSMWQTHNRDWTLRARVNTSFAYRWRLQQGGSYVRGLTDALRCFLFYIRRLDLTVRERSPRERLLRALMASPDLHRWRLRPDACTLLIDAGVVSKLAAETAADEVTSSTSGERTAWSPMEVAQGIAVGGPEGREVVRLGNRIFLPTLDLIIPPDHAMVASRV